MVIIFRKKMKNEFYDPLIKFKAHKDANVTINMKRGQ